MAYNPFDFFRRNQKVLFAVITVIIMFVFILQFGQGDFFSWFPQQLAKWQTTGEVMAKIDGATIKASQLQDVANQRGLANGYMTRLSAQALASARTSALAKAEAATPDVRPQLTGTVNGLVNLEGTRVPSAEDGAFARQRVTGAIGELARLQETTPKQEDRDRVKVVRTYAELVRAELARRGVSERGEGGVYFANQPNRTERDRLEFLLWKKKADQLGIRYTPEDVAKLVAAEVPFLTEDELKAAATKAAAEQGKKVSDLFDALADEFRVRAAQTAVLGLGEVRDPSGVTAGTTQARYETFIKETTATKYTFLTIPVEAYLPLVKGEPTEAELTKIFNEASGTDPDPASPRPGIREPRKVGVQWVEVSGKEDYYQKLATARGAAFKKVQADPAAQAVLGPTVAPPEAAFGYDEYVKTQRAIAAYRQTKDANPGRPQVGNLLMGSLGGGLAWDPNNPYSLNQELPQFSNPIDKQDALLDAELATPELAAALAGLTVGGGATFAPVPSASAAVLETAFRQSREKRVTAGMRAFHFPTVGGVSGLADAAAATAAVAVSSTAPLPQAVVQAQLDVRTADALRVLVATEDLQAFEKELTRIMGQKADVPKGADKNAQERAERENKAKVTKEAGEYVAKWVAERGLKTGGTTEPRSVHQLADDPGLAPLLEKDLMVTGFGAKAKNSRAATSFGQAFVSEMQFGQSPGGGFQARLRPVSGLYEPRSYDPMGGRSALQQFGGGQEYAPFGFGGQLRVSDNAPLTAVWRTAEVDAVRPLSLGSDKTAREKCRAIWKMTKARELARKAADEAAAIIRKGANESEVGNLAYEAQEFLKKPFADIKAADGTKVADRFQLFDRAPEFSTANMPITPGFGQDSSPTVGQFNPQHRAVVYDTPKMREELLANKDKPVGTTFVFTDQPQANLYLTVVAKREPEPDFMFRNYVLYPQEKLEPGQGFMPLGPQALAPRFAVAASEADRKTALALLKAEFRYTDENPKLDETKD